MKLKRQTEIHRDFIINVGIFYSQRQKILKLIRDNESINEFVRIAVDEKIKKEEKN